MKNNKGSVLIWAVVVILIFSVFAGAGITIGYSMVKRNTDKNISRQMYLSARSAATMVATELVSDSNKNILNSVINNSPKVISSDSIFSDELMGDTRVSIRCNADKKMIVITAKAKRDKKESIVSAIVKKDNNGKWMIYGYDNKDLDESRV